MAQRPTKLDLHRAKYHMSNIELLLYYELEEEDRSRISSEFFALIKRSPELDHYTVFSELLSEWGVMCPHPQDQRLYSGREKMLMHSDKHRWFFCSCCRTNVMCFVPKAKAQKAKSSGRL